MSRRAPTRRTQNFSVGASARGNLGPVALNAKINYALSQLNTEKKLHEFQVSSTATTAVPYVVTLNSLQQGTTNITRIGDSVRWASIHLKYSLDNHATTDLRVRVLLVRDHTPNGVQALTTDVLSGPGLGVTDFRNLDQTNRFDILYDKVHVKPSKTTSSVNLTVHEKYFDLAERRAKKNARSFTPKSKKINETNYALGNAGGIADISENAFYLMVLGDHPTDYCDGSYQLRLRYLDN